MTVPCLCDDYVSMQNILSVLRALQKDIHYAAYCNNYDSYTHYK